MTIKSRVEKRVMEAEVDTEAPGVTLINFSSTEKLILLHMKSLNMSK